MYDLIIIGAGPAGLCAGVYAARKQLNTMLISMDMGGQVNSTLGIQNYLGYQFIEGPELIRKFEEQLKQFPIETKIGQLVSSLKKLDENFEVLLEGGEHFSARAVLLATGKKPRKLNVSGEAAYLGRGVTYCAVCDGPVFAGKRVAVIGGGNSAVSAVLDMGQISAHIDLVSLTELTADPVLLDHLARLKNLTMHKGYEVEKIEGKEFVSGIVIRDARTGEHKLLEVSGVFVEIGLAPNSELVRDLLELNRLDEVPVSCFSETTVPGLYAAGDVTDVPEKQIIIAAGEGAKAALQVHQYLRHLTD